MEEPQSSDWSAKTAESLRALRDQADHTLSGHRESVSRIEEELTHRIKQITEELACDRVSEEMEVTASVQQKEELQHLRQSQADNQSEIQQLQDQLASQSEGFSAELSAREEELASLKNQWEQAQAEREQMSQKLQEVRSECDAARSGHGELAEQVRQLRERLESESSEREALDEECESLSQQSQELCKQRDEIASQLEAARQALDDLRSQECSECQRAREELATAGQQLREAHTKLQQLEEAHCKQTAELDSTREDLATAQAKNEKAAGLLSDAEQHIIELENNEHHEEQLAQMRRKFELAFADVQKLKRENAELHEELVRRPESNDQESPELVSLRSERDALAARVAEFNSEPEQPFDADTQQEISDLQRRFELAVEDVRDLKQQNANLHEQLQSGSHRNEDADGVDGSDWQAQKARLLAELDAEETGDVTPQRTKQRATVEGTIAITDRVVDEKDREIAGLKEQLKEIPEAVNFDDMKRELHEEILSKDELIQAERSKLFELQETMQEKLRQAELDISVQRATLAREQASLEENLAQLQHKQHQEGETLDGKPGRRWLSALGLKDEENEK